jgi:glucose/arabinose dehydrogenase
VASGFSSPTGLFWSRDNTLLVANRNAGEVVRLHPDGKKTVLSRNHKTPVGLAQTDDGSIFVSCYGGSVDRIAPDGKSASVYTGLNTPGVGIIADGPDSVLVVDYGGTTVARVNTQGKASTVADGLRSPVGLTRMPDDRLLVGTWADNAAFAFETR